MTTPPRPYFKRLPTWAGAGTGLFWGGAIALLADRTGSHFLMDFGIRAGVVVTATFLGAGFGWLCCWGLDALMKRWK